MGRDENKRGIGAVFHALREGRNEHGLIERESARRIEKANQLQIQSAKIVKRGHWVLHAKRLESSTRGQAEPRGRFEPILEQGSVAVQAERLDREKISRAKVGQNRLQLRKISAIAQIEVLKAFCR